jgi:ribosomal protein S18 acetylase RimI-like enzyme
MPGDVDFRPFTDADVATVLAMMREYYALEGYAGGWQFSEGRARRALAALGGGGTGRLWLIRDGAEVVGYVAVTFTFSLAGGGSLAGIDEMYVQPARRGRGIGAQALALVERTAREVGCSAVRLEVNRRNEPAQRFYRRMGFRTRERFLTMDRRLDG